MPHAYEHGQLARQIDAVPAEPTIGAVFVAHGVHGRDHIVRGLGLVVRFSRAATAAIEKLGGNVSYVKPAASEPFPVSLLRRWLPPDYIDEIEQINLNSTQVTDAGLAHLQGLTALQQYVHVNRPNSLDGDGLMTPSREPTDTSHPLTRARY